MSTKFPKILKYLRKEKELSQQGLADKLDLRRYNISDWEQGRTEPDIANIILLSDFFGVTTDYLLGKEK